MLNTRPSVVFADHAPVAILAARSLGIPVMLFGSGYALPPMRSPLPAMRSWQPVDDSLLAAADYAALSCANQVLAQLGGARLHQLCDLFNVAESALLTVPELDHFDRQGQTRYWGKIHTLNRESHTPAIWPSGRGPRLFAYIRHTPIFANAILSALAASGCASIVFFPDWHGEYVVPPNVTILTEPADLRQMTEQATIGIASGLATATAFLMSGKPVLCIPSYFEQQLIGRRIEQLRVGCMATEPYQIGSGLGRLLDDPMFAKNAEIFAHRYAVLNQQTIIFNLCARAEELANRALQS